MASNNDEPLEVGFAAVTLQDQGIRLRSFFCRFDGGEKQEVQFGTFDTVLQALTKQFNYLQIEEEFVIKRKDNSVIATHFPCHLLSEDELLVVSGVTNSPDPRPERYVTFYIYTEGGENTSNKLLLKNTKLKKHGLFCVYGLMGETVKEALSRDGRFTDDVINKCHLYDTEKKVTVAITELVDHVNGRHFQITFERKKYERRSGSTLQEALPDEEFQ